MTTIMAQNENNEKLYARVVMEWKKTKQNKIEQNRTEWLSGCVEFIDLIIVIP